jgi:hypothetical protein
MVDWGAIGIWCRSEGGRRVSVSQRIVVHHRRLASVTVTSVSQLEGGFVRASGASLEPGSGVCGAHAKGNKSYESIEMEKLQKDFMLIWQS